MSPRPATYFVLPVATLSEGTHAFHFPIPKAFFSERPEALLQDCVGALQIRLQKTSTLVELWLKISCEVGLCCDRTLRPFKEKLHIEKKLWLKWAEKAGPIDEEMIVLPYGKHSLCLDSHIYDYISLALPMKRLHPECRTETTPQADVLLYSTQHQTTPSASKAIDARWRTLQTLETQNHTNHGTS